MQNKILGVMIVAGVCSLSGCATRDISPPEILAARSSPLIAYMRDRGYEPLRIPREKWGPGTVVSFDANGNENIVMFNDQCVKFVEPAFNSDADTADVRVANVALPNASYKRDRTIGADIALEKGISPNVDVSTAFNDERVREVEVRVGRAKQWVVSDLTLTQKLQSLLAANTACAQLMLQPANFVIDDVLVVGDSSFSFKGNNNTTLNLDLALLRAIKVDPSLDVQLQGKSELPIGDPLIVGYKLYKVQARTGTAGTDLTARRIPQQEIDVLKRRTR